jgi:two-component system, OmpR family, sensor histidine kinase KdpD
MSGTIGRPLLAGAAKPRLRDGLLTSIAAVAAATGLAYALKLIAPVASLGVVYLPGVLLVSTLWGLRLGLFTSLLSAAAFNWFLIPPVGRFTIADSRNWVALAAFATVAAVMSTVAELARARAAEAERRRQEADLAADLARALLAGTSTADALAALGQRVAEALGIAAARLALGTVDPGDREQSVPLLDGDQRLATLLVPASIEAEAEERLARRVAPALSALIAIALQRDRMQREELETAALRKSDDLKTVLLRAVSHDLRSPLTSILAAGAALDSPSLGPAERAELSGVVIEEGGRLSRLIDNLLDLSRLEAGRAEPRREDADLGEVLEAARDAVAERNGAVQLRMDANLPAVDADPAQLERAFANLIENAARHGRGKPVLVRARAIGKRLIVRVVDQGSGIPEAEQSRIFEPFYRGPGQPDERSGSGLGLAIARGFVEANGGRIWVESLPGQGTTFVVALPLDGSGSRTAR